MYPAFQARQIARSREEEKRRNEVECSTRVSEKCAYPHVEAKYCLIGLSIIILGARYERILKLG